MPDVNAIMQTSSEAVSTLSNVSRCFCIRAARLAGPSSCDSITLVRLGHDGRAASSSSMRRLSQIACVISAAVMTSISSLARSSGIVVTTTQPAFTTPSQHAAITSLLNPRSSTRLPGHEAEVAQQNVRDAVRLRQQFGVRHAPLRRHDRGPAAQAFRDGRVEQFRRAVQRRGIL